jgi:hypothetical protein
VHCAAGMQRAPQLLRVVIVAIGSIGDSTPLLGPALELVQRGCAVTMLVAAGMADPIRSILHDRDIPSKVSLVEVEISTLYRFGREQAASNAEPGDDVADLLPSLAAITSSSTPMSSVRAGGSKDVPPAALAGATAAEHLEEAAEGAVQADIKTLLSAVHACDPDILVVTASSLFAYHIAESLGLALVVLSPGLIPSPEPAHLARLHEILDSTPTATKVLSAVTKGAKRGPRGKFQEFSPLSLEDIEHFLLPVVLHTHPHRAIRHYLGLQPSMFVTKSQPLVLGVPFVYGMHRQLLLAAALDDKTWKSRVGAASSKSIASVCEVLKGTDGALGKCLAFGPWKLPRSEGARSRLPHKIRDVLITIDHKSDSSKLVVLTFGSMTELGLGPGEAEQYAAARAIAEACPDALALLHIPVSNVERSVLRHSVGLFKRPRDSEEAVAPPHGKRHAMTHSVASSSSQSSSGQSNGAMKHSSVTSSTSSSQGASSSESVMANPGSFATGPSEGLSLRASLLSSTKSLHVAQLADRAFVCLGVLDHDTLFKEAAVVVHHCGAGTTNSAIAASCVHVPCPCAFDQECWSRAIARLGIGTPPVKSSSKSFAKDVAASVKAALEPASPLPERARECGEFFAAQLASSPDPSAQVAIHVLDFWAYANAQ